MKATETRNIIIINVYPTKSQKEIFQLRQRIEDIFHVDAEIEMVTLQKSPEGTLAGTIDCLGDYDCEEDFCSIAELINLLALIAEQMGMKEERIRRLDSLVI
jgi:hypothetical protein